tara:strand:+ start:1848 stop:2192 length:345 start_codon:yes stop_codon:yes gene_type:complete
MAFKMTGEVLKVSEIQSFANDFKKLDVIIRTEAKYPQDIKLEVLGARAVKASDEISIGDILQANFDVKGSEYNGKHYVSVTMFAWEILTEAKYVPNKAIDEVPSIDPNEDENPF